MSQQPAAFLSYVHFDDEHEDGRLTKLRERLSGEVHMQMARKFEIFQDRKDIHWGQEWQKRIDESLDAATFLIAILTPNFFASAYCRSELERFLEREKQLKRNDLVLPVYYVNCTVLNDAAKLEADPLAKALAARQYVDWRDLRFEPFTSPQVGKLLVKMATQIMEALAVPSEGAQAVPAMNVERIEVLSAGLPRYPAQKTEPPTHVVGALHHGNYLTLTDALQAASPGDRILVRAGLYKEGVIIDKPVEIIGDGNLEEAVIEATGKNTVLFKANMGRIANLTLRQADSKESEEWYCLDIAQGRLDLEGCDITSRGPAAIAIHGGADPRLRRNRIHDGKKGGVYVYGDGQGTLEDNDIFRNGVAGVAISSGGNPTLRGNRIYNGSQEGVFVWDDGQGTLEDNEIDGNTFAGVAIRTGGHPTLRRNRIHDGKQEGVWVGDNGQGTLEENEIYGNALAGVAILRGGHPTLRRNRIHDGKQEGVWVGDDGQGTLEENEIYGNAFAGVAILRGGYPTVRRNRIHDGKREGVFIRDGGGGVFEGNDVYGNAWKDWDIASDCEHKVTR